MINVNQITSQLERLGDAELRKYTEMHKSDPYIVALAVDESNRRKRARQGAQMQAPQQPKVVDQALARMAAPMPESVGIGALPAGDMQFADGGIVAFADGGDVERYNGEYGSLTGDVNRILQKSPYQRTPEENALLQQAGVELQSRTLGSDSGVAGANTFLQGLGPKIRNYFTSGASRLSDEELAKQPAVGGAQNERILRGLGIAPSTTPLEPQASYSNEGRREPALGAVATAPEQSRAAPKVDTTQRTPPASGTAPSAGASATGSASLEALFKRLQGQQDTEQTALDAQRTSVADRLKMLGKQNLADFEAEEAKRGDVFKGREARLAEREGRLSEMKDQNFGLALLQAGAAMMSTPGGLGVALGKGVDVGARQYAAGVDKLNAAQERLLEAKDRLEELRVNRDDLSSKERRQLKSEANRYELEAEKLFMEGAEKKLGYKREDAKTLFAGITTLLGQETAAGATIQAAKIRSQDQKDYLAELRGGTMVENARKNIMAEVIKANPHADEPTRQQLFQAEWQKALQSNPALAKYAGVAPGGGGASTADPLGILGTK